MKTKTTLPIDAFSARILKAVRDNPVTIITAETGAGKTTQGPQILLDAGYDVIVTQPRRLAVRTVAARVAEEYDTPLGDVVGYRMRGERKDSAVTRCLFATDGLALMNELLGHERPSVLVIDEVHEWNLSIEILVAWARYQLSAGSDFKLVLMSATLESERLSEFFGGAPIIEVPGRTFSVVQQTPSGGSLEDETVALLRQGHNVLVFQPTKEAIKSTVAYLRATGMDIEVLPLHGELTAAEQEKCFRSYDRPKCVVATNVAQTSITIPDVDAVVDSGIERRKELVNGVEGLYLMPISQSDGIQRRGRAGRTKNGIYVDLCPVPWSERPEFPKAEILRIRLDQTVLLLAGFGIDMEVLRFFHQPDLKEIRDAKRALHSLGCMDQTDKVTRIGRLVAKLPVSVRYARMIVEADRLGVVDDVITIAAIMEQGGINGRVCQKCVTLKKKSCTCWQEFAPGESTSDAFVQLSLYHAVSGMTRDEMVSKGIFAKAFSQAEQLRRQLAKSLKDKVKLGSSGRREDILKAICAGMVDHLYMLSDDSYRGNDGDSRQLVRGSVVRGSQWVVGQPWDLQIETKDGPMTLRLLRMVSAVDPLWLADVAPQLSKLVDGQNPRYDEDREEVVSTTEFWFNGQLVREFVTADPSHGSATKLRQDARNRHQWSNWADKPEIAIPDPADPTATIPDIVVCAYGVDGETGESLFAFGAVTQFGYRLHLSDPWFKTMWTRDREEAERSNADATTFLETSRGSAIADAQSIRLLAKREGLKQVTEPLRLRVLQLSRSNGHDGKLSYELRSRLYDSSRGPYVFMPEAVRLWTTDAKSLLAEVEAAQADP